MGKLSSFFNLFKRNSLSQKNDKSIINEYENIKLNLIDDDCNLNKIDDNENINILKEQEISNYTLNNTLNNESDFLKLFKYDSIADSSKTFNIETALNNNWDKIDTFATNVSQQMEHKADLDENGKVLASQLPEISSSGDDITITDVSGNFTSDNVEGALAELFLYANDGKTAIRNAISAKGVTVSLEDTFTLLASKITSQMCKFEGTAGASQVLNGRTFINSTGEVVTGTMASRGAVEEIITTQGGQYTVTAGYHNGSGKVTANIGNLVADNIKNGVNVGGVVGTYSPSQIYQGEYTYVNSGGGTPKQINVPNLPFVPDYIEVYVISLMANSYVGYGFIDNLSASLKSMGISKDYPGFSTLSQLINSGNFVSRSDTVNYSDTYKSSYGITNVGTNYFKIQTQVPYNGDYKVVYTLKKYL